MAASDEDEIDLAQRAYDLAGALKASFTSPSPAARAEAQWRAEQPVTLGPTALIQKSFEQQQRVIGHDVRPWYPPPPRPPDPLEVAINDVSVSIYEVIRLAEERA